METKKSLMPVTSSLYWLNYPDVNHNEKCHQKKNSLCMDIKQPIQAFGTRIKFPLWSAEDWNLNGAA